MAALGHVFPATDKPRISFLKRCNGYTDWYEMIKQLPFVQYL